MPPPGRPLPLGLFPVPGESLAGYVLALAEHLDVPPGQVALRTGLSDVSNYAGAQLASSMQDDMIERFATVTRTDPSQVRGMLLTAYVDLLYDAKTTAGPGWNGVSGRIWAWNSRTRACPLCLDESRRRHGTPVWKTAWRTAWSYACVRHECLLIDTCPAGHLLAGGVRQSPLIASMTLPSPADVCRHRLSPAALCGVPLAGPEAVASATKLTGAPGRALLDCQGRFDAVFAAAEDGRPAPSFHSLGQPVSTPQYLRDVRALARLHAGGYPVAAGHQLPVAVAASAADRTAAPREERLLHSTPFPSAALQAAVLSSAVACLDLGAAEGSETISRAVGAALETQPRLIVGIRQHNDPSPALTAALGHPHRNVLHAQRLRVAMPDADKAPTLDPRHVPAILDEATTRTRFGWIEGATPRLTASCVSLSLVRLANGCTIPEAAALLAVPEGAALGSFVRLQRFLRRQDGLARFRQDVALLAADWAQDTSRPDYGRRRHALAGWELSTQQWDDFVRGLRDLPVLGSRPWFHDPDAAAVRRIPATIYVWARITAGDPQAHPLLIQDSATTARRESRVSTRLRTLTRAAGVEGRLDELTRTVATALHV